jgi:positive regulator of sigma E activity
MLRYKLLVVLVALIGFVLSMYILNRVPLPKPISIVGALLTFYGLVHGLKKYDRLPRQRGCESDRIRGTRID